MTKHLRVALAMGGGTSQGTFSGVAVTEGLKLLALYGDNGHPPKSLEIDAISGASAGTLTLAILMRSLLTPLEKSKRAAAEARLVQWHPDVDKLVSCTRS